MPDEKVTCRYCPSDQVNDVPVPGGSIPLCDRHAAHVNQRALAELDRIAGEPVYNDRVKRRGSDPATADQGGPKPDPTF